MNNFVQSYAFKQWNMNGTSIDHGDSTYYYFHAVTTTNEVAVDFALILSPNPTTSQFTITSPNIIDEIKITDMLGLVVYHAKPYDKNLSLHLNNNGIYFVTVLCGEQSVTKKLVVQQ